MNLVFLYEKALILHIWDLGMNSFWDGPRTDLGLLHAFVASCMYSETPKELHPVLRRVGACL